MINRIVKEDLLYLDNEPDTILTLHDCSEMSYKLESILSTKSQGKLKISFNYLGLAISEMRVTQIIEDYDDEETDTYEFEFDSEIFIKYYKEFLLNHINQWDTDYAFNRENIIIAFFNEVLTSYKTISYVIC